MNQIELFVNNSPLPSFVHNGTRFIVAPDGGDYEIGITVSGGDFPARHIHTSVSRVEMVVSVDGLSVVDGKPASVSSSGYVVSGGYVWYLRIPGWKVDGQHAAKFAFNTTDSSYSAQSGNGTSNIGVIGLAVFAEKPNGNIAANSPIVYTGHHLGGGGICRSASSGIGGQSMRSANLPSEVGTAFGGKTDFATTTTQFERGAKIGVWEVHYRTRDWFRANGIAIPGEMKLGSAFPADNDVCKPPAGWRG